MYLFDYHMHSDHSTDGQDSIMKMSTAAAGKGLREIAISDHFEPTLGNEAYPSYDAEKYFREIKEANEMFGQKIKIKTAVELGQPHVFPEYSLSLIENHNYDYVIASAHKMSDNTDFGDLVYSRENLDDNCGKYLTELENLAGWNKFDCIGHLDLVKRYASRYNIEAKLIHYREKLENILKTLIENGKGIEINTSGLRQSAKECMPGYDILRFYKELGGEIITLGSDAHNHFDVGAGIADAVELLRTAGFEYMTVYEKRKPEMIRIAQEKTFWFQAQRTA
ncbi:histidinol-phosphatase HisJ family protein [Parasporobacterium paucivorans]|uniref:Histidinol-phosphatase n=1 Tax=Parasporobacterium paucivorans DSM 15970 TaxID=1122934 RepID=A0A1M6GL56_9FIRM|nr:histidinol-phosphatase HisJ family protein [Parasporobacterium paucivorans]SHJ10643.1 histidinol-phosphatase (PHP family) [Parasporobacterium paucivorans DSM 15970]